MKMNFDAIIFDLGGVILNIDYNRTIQAFKNLGIEKFDSLYTQAQQNLLFDKLETGSISETEFYGEIQKISGQNLSVEDISNAWNAMLLDLPKERIEFLRQLANQVPIYLLSNTNSIHLTAFQTIIEKTFGKKDLLEEIFDETYYSHLMKLRKPNVEAFNYIIERNKLNAENTLFIDDSIQHIAGAKIAGLKTKHLTNSDITNLFS